MTASYITTTFASDNPNKHNLHVDQIGSHLLKVFCLNREDIAFAFVKTLGWFRLTYITSSRRTSHQSPTETSGPTKLCKSLATNPALENK